MFPIASGSPLQAYSVPFFSPVGSDQSPGQTSEIFIMDPLSLFHLALGLPAPREVVDVAFDPKSGRIDATSPSPRGHDLFVRIIVARNTSRSTTHLSATGVT